MPTIDCSLVSDGPADAALLPMIRWAVAQHAADAVVDAVWADLRRSLRPPRTLAAKITTALALYPCHILVVHRDAERQPPDWRRTEIREAIASAMDNGLRVPHVCVIPVRMQEAWLLLDRNAIRRAADNPHGHAALEMPQPNRIEKIPDPKHVLHDLLRAASELRGRRLHAFRPERRARLVSENMQDMAVLRALPAFRRFENDVREVLNQLRSGARDG